jgi:hypothetical protein
MSMTVTSAANRVEETITCVRETLEDPAADLQYALEGLEVRLSRLANDLRRSAPAGVEPPTDPDVLARLDPDRVSAYLAANGWQQVSPPPWVRAGTCWQNHAVEPPVATDQLPGWLEDGGDTVWIPDPRLVDAASVWRTLVDTLAAVEERSPTAVLADLTVTPPDQAIAAHSVYEATNRACTQAAGELRQTATELRVAAGSGLPPDEHAAADLRAAADRLVAAVLANAAATAELASFGTTTVTANPATTADPPL